MDRRHAEPAARVGLGDAPAAAGLYRPSLGGGLASRRSRQFHLRAVVLRGNPGKLPMRWLWQRLLIHRFAPVVDAGRAHLGAIGECHKQVGQLGVAMLLEGPRDGIAPVAWAADNRERLRPDVG